MFTIDATANYAFIGHLDRLPPGESPGFIGLKSASFNQPTVEIRFYKSTISRPKRNSFQVGEHAHAFRLFRSDLVRLFYEEHRHDHRGDPR